MTTLKLIVCLSTPVLPPLSSCKTNDVFLFYLILVDLVYWSEGDRGYCLTGVWLCSVQCVLIQQTSNIDRWNINEDQFDRVSVIHHLAQPARLTEYTGPGETITNNHHFRNYRDK